MKILISPLDWGLGHATRIIPIIQLFLIKKADVHIAASGSGLELLKKNFRHTPITFHRLNDMQITYSKNEKFFLTNLFFQLPGLIKKKNRDHKTILDLHAKHHFDIIISDNRYGILAEGARNIFITHQLQILSGINRLYDKIMLKLHKTLYKKYDEIWVIDHPQAAMALVPRLSIPEKSTHPVTRYIGHLTQFKKTIHTRSTPSSQNHVLALLSGPEPARSILFEMILSQAIHLNSYNFTIIAGSDSCNKNIEGSHIQILGLIPMQEIQQHIESADIIICRSGYSTIMDLMAFRKKAIIIPTPGQTEQEYIADMLDKRKIFPRVIQSELNLPHDLDTAISYDGFPDQYYEDVNTLYTEPIDSIL